MPIEMTSNDHDSKIIELDVVVERDEDIFLGITAIDPDSGETIFDYFADDPGMIDHFFEIVTKAQEEFERLLEEDKEKSDG